MRCFVDFRRLNSATLACSYSLPLMEHCIGSLGWDAKIFSAVDALWGYWKVPITEADHDKTNIKSHMGTFRY